MNIVWLLFREPLALSGISLIACNLVICGFIMLRCKERFRSLCEPQY